MKTMPINQNQGNHPVASATAEAVPVSPIADGGPIYLAPPDPEVPEKKDRRKFTAAYKLNILQKADAMTGTGQIGALLRREGIYSSHLTTWRKQREHGQLDALTPKKRGRKKKPTNPLARRVAQLEGEKRRLEQKLKQAELIIEAQKKISQILGITQNPEGSNS